MSRKTINIGLSITIERLERIDAKARELGVKRSKVVGLLIDGSLDQLKSIDKIQSPKSSVENILKNLM